MIQNWLKHAEWLVAGALIVLANIAHAAPCSIVLNEVCSSRALSAYAQIDDDEDDEDEDEDDGVEEYGDVDLDDEERDFDYDEDEGSLMVDLENCEPGKYWMADIEDGVPLPCR